VPFSTSYQAINISSLLTGALLVHTGIVVLSEMGALTIFVSHHDAVTPFDYISYERGIDYWGDFYPETWQGSGYLSFSSSARVILPHHCLTFAYVVRSGFPVRIQRILNLTSTFPSSFQLTVRL
jgi:hypothetical protein